MNDCYCDYERPDFYHKANPVAKQNHVCSECGCTILPGEKYERVRAKWDGDVGIVKTCPDCVAIRSALLDMDCFCWTHLGLLEDVEIQFQNADFPPGMRFSCLRVLAEHRRGTRNRRRTIVVRP